MNNFGDMTTRMINGKQYFMIGIGDGCFKYFLVDGKKKKLVKVKNPKGCK